MAALKIHNNSIEQIELYSMAILIKYKTIKTSFVPSFITYRKQNLLVARKQTFLLSFCINAAMYYTAFCL